MSDDRPIIQLYNEEEQRLVNFIEFKRLQVYERQYALLQPEEDPEQLLAFRVEFPEKPFSAEDDDEVYIYVTDDEELFIVEEALSKLHS